MRRLIELLYDRLLGIRIKTARRHHADLRKMLADLCSARDVLDTEITQTAYRLTEARQRLDEIEQRARRGFVTTNPPPATSCPGEQSNV